MLHQLIVQVAQWGGETTLGLLLAASVVSIGIISNRIAYLVRNRVDADLFARQILQLTISQDWSKARAIARHSSASICVVMAAGLSQIDRGRRSVQLAMQSAKIHERNRLEGQLGWLSAIGRCSLLLGLLGTLFDVLELSRLVSESTGRANGPHSVDAFDTFFILGPTAAGLMVAIPALLASTFFKSQIRGTLRQVDALAKLLLLQVPKSKLKPMKASASQAA